jgi:hypothetical protein
MSKKIAWALLAAALLAGTAAAQKKIDESKPAQRDGLVRISNIAGSIKVIGWDRDEISLTGTLASNIERVDFSSEGGLATVDVVIRTNSWSAKSTEIELRLPAGSSLDVDSVSAGIETSGVTGKMRLSTVSGNIKAYDGPSAYIIESTSGTVELRAKGGGGRIRTISGNISVKDPGGDLRAESVSGNIAVKGGRLDGGSFETTSGRIKLDVDLGKGARLESTSMSGSIELVFPSDVSASFELSTFSGRIENGFKSADGFQADFGAKSLSFSTGKDARVTAQSFSGKLSLSQR